MKTIYISTLLFFFSYSTHATEQPTDQEINRASSAIALLFTPIVEQLELSVNQFHLNSFLEENHLTVKNGLYRNPVAPKISIVFENLELDCDHKFKQPLLLERLLQNCFYNSKLEIGEVDIRTEKSRFFLPQFSLSIEEQQANIVLKLKKIFKWKIKGSFKSRYIIEKQHLILDIKKLKLGPVSLKKMVLNLLKKANSERIKIDGHAVTLDLSVERDKKKKKNIKNSAEESSFVEIMLN
jgi:hypothetical protein